MQISRAIFTLDSLGKVEREVVLRESDSPSQFHHLVRVLRIRRGGQVELLDQNSQRIISTIVKELSPNEINLTVVEESQRVIHSPVTLIIGLPEFDVLERVVEKSTELQLSSVKIFIPEHTQHKDGFNRLTAKLSRLEKIRDAARIQSGAGPLKIEIFKNLKSALEKIEEKKGLTQIRLVASLQPNNHNLQEFLHKKHPLELEVINTDILLVVGPEGDLGFEEYKMCSDAGFAPISLGNSVLRVETAAIGFSFTVFNYFNR